MPEISRRLRRVAVSTIRQMALRAEQREGAVSLGWGLPSFDTPRHIRDAVRRALADDPSVGRYTHLRGTAALRRAISRKWLEETAAPPESESEILVTIGAQQALSAALLAIVDPGDEADPADAVLLL